MTNNTSLELINVSKIYKDGFQAVKNINFKVFPGDCFALLGPNGAGKSTTLGMISSLINKTSGIIKICDYNLDKNLYMAKKKLGFMPQELNLNIFETPLQILLSQAGFFGITRTESFPYAIQLLKKMSLLKYHNTQVRFLSGGMKRRVMVARALIHKPSVLILDEPTVGVDVELRITLWKYMKILNQEGLTIILTTHYLEEAENMCNKLALMNNGELHIISDMKTLLNSSKTYHYIFYLKHPIFNFNEIFKINNNDIQIQFIDNLSIKVEIKKNITLNQLFLIFNNKKIEIINVKSKHNKLEHIFVNLLKKGEIL